jgi:hypothetical protein
MTARRVVATVEDDVCLATRYGSANEYLSESYIPGSAIWGVLARLSGIRPGDRPDADFRRVFYSGEVVFTCLYPRMRTGSRAMPIPRSARIYKPRPGFEDEGHVLFSLEGPSGTPATGLTPLGVRDWLLAGIPEQDTEEWQGLDGFYAEAFGQEASSGGRRRLVAAEMVLNGHTDRSTRAGVAREGQLFSRTDLARREEFVGAVAARTDAAETALEAILDRAGNFAGRVPIGRQPGHISVTMSDAALEWADAPEELGDPKHVSITLLSHAVVADCWLRALPYLPRETVAQELGLQPETVTLVRHFSTFVPLHGWNGAYNRPREVEAGLAMGSAFLYEVTWPAEWDATVRKGKLAELQAQGVGLRRAEGCGEIRVNEPFHRIFRHDGRSQ